MPERKSRQKRQQKRRTFKFWAVESKYWGVTRMALDTLSQIRSGKDRAAAFYLLSTLLLKSAWDFYDPEADFYISRRQLSFACKWGHDALRKYTKLLTDAGILNSKHRGGAWALVYWIKCAPLGIRAKAQRSKKKKKISYISKFWPMTTILRDNMTEMIPEWRGKRGRPRSNCLWLLANILIYSDWNPAQPGDRFSCSLYMLESGTGWRRNKIRKYRDKLIEVGFLEVELPRVRGIRCTYALNLKLAGFKAPVENPVKNILRQINQNQ